MTGPDLQARFASLTTPLIADACVRLGRDVRCAPADITPLRLGAAIAGPALPARHYGSVDAFLEVLETAAPGGVLVIDNEGRRDEACIGDLITLEARGCGLAGIVVWGLVRDTPELAEIGLPIYATGRCPLGPRGMRPRPIPTPGDAQLGPVRVAAGDLVFADDDGVLVIDGGGIAEVLDVADDIARRERAQAARIRAGHSLRQQLRFADYLAERARDPSYTLRTHLLRLGGAVEV